MDQHIIDDVFVRKAISASQESVEVGAYPVGAVIVKDDKIVSVGFSNGKKLCDATLHAEIDAIRKASAELGSRSLDDVTLYTSMEPCVMCFSAAFWAYIPRIVYSLSRKQVDKNYYMGEHDISVMNERNYRRKIELIHHLESSEEALRVVRDWERKSDTSKHSS
jgi:tRNA(Arg) A34 adenosine deaminase TadA